MKKSMTKEVAFRQLKTSFSCVYSSNKNYTITMFEKTIFMREKERKKKLGCDCQDVLVRSSETLFRFELE